MALSRLAFLSDSLLALPFARRTRARLLLRTRGASSACAFLALQRARAYATCARARALARDFLLRTRRRTPT